jgi:predicted RNase H-like HicB family nuclease
MLKVEIEREVDRRWIAEIVDLPGVIIYGETRGEAVIKAEALALRVLADRVEHLDNLQKLLDLFPNTRHSREGGNPSLRQRRWIGGFPLSSA